jgi:transcriptional regulator with PAS, ATPase and Fis domain
VAASDANVFIHGESGTGKELFASATHQWSLRSGRPFVTINCAAIPEDLVESELFGYRQGAFTGAIGSRAGLLEQAAGGSLLLDEIGEMPPLLQTKLLRVLQEREFRPLGGQHEIKVDFRLICTTNVDVTAALTDGRLREDLYFRVNTISIRVPPLRDRGGDILLLADHFLEKYRRRYGRLVRGLSQGAREILLRYHWPGNVRELESAVECGVLLTKHADIGAQDLPEMVRRPRRAADAARDARPGRAGRRLPRSSTRYPLSVS